MMRLKRILVATDLGEPADTALAYGRELARTCGAALDVLHVAQNLLTRAFGTDGYIAAYPEMQRDLEEAARARLERLVNDEGRAALGARIIVRTSNSPAIEIIAYASEADIDLIVIGTHGRSAMAQLLMGSVAERVVRTAPCPVLTVRHPARDFVLPDALLAVAHA
jgi:nucleotide-binding universal stress UspA family protein